MAALFLNAPVLAQSRISVQETRDVVPADAKVEQFTLTRDGRRTYYTTPAGGLWLYDHDRKTAARVTNATLWDLAVSPNGDALAYTKSGDDRRQQFVWVLPIAPATGLAAAAERRVSASSGDAPAISPDGRWIAFARDDETGVGQSIVVVLIAGGKERVVAPAQPAGIRNIRWTPDGKTLYFGVNAPVPFTCAESCLTLTRQAPLVRASIRRIAIAGGLVTTIALTNNPFPGLSPDGRMLVFGDTTRPRGFVVSDASGRRLDTLTFAAGHTPIAWSNASTVLTMASGTVQRLGTVQLESGAGQRTTLLATTDFSREPVWTPDGQMVAVLQFTSDGAGLRLMKRDGTSPRVIRLPAGGYSSGAWTADQKWMIFTRFQPDGPQAITAVEIATGNTKELRLLAEGQEWVVDGQTVILSEITAQPSGPRSATLWQVALDGNSSRLGELRVEANTTLIPIDRSRVLLRVAAREFRVADIASGAERLMLKMDQGFIAVRPSFSVDRQWAAFRVNPNAPNNTQMNVVELVRLDGSARRTVKLPFSAEAGANNPAILPGATAVVVLERGGPVALPGVFLVDSTTREATKLLEITVAGRPSEITLSPDGRTLLYLVWETRPPVVSAINLSSIIK